MTAAYTAWDPTDPGAPSVAELIAPFGVTKQAFYDYLRREGIPLKNARTAPAPAPVATDSDTINHLLELLVDCRVRCRTLERALNDAGLTVPA